MTPTQEEREAGCRIREVQRGKQGQEAELSPSRLITEHRNVSLFAPVHEVPKP